MCIYRKKIKDSKSSDSYAQYIDALKLVLSASSLKIKESCYSANSLFYTFAAYEKPFENETQFIEAFELHDALYETVVKLQAEDEAEKAEKARAQRPPVNAEAGMSFTMNFVAVRQK